MKGSNKVLLIFSKYHHKIKMMYDQICLHTTFYQIHYKRDSYYSPFSKYNTSPLFRAVVCPCDGVVSLLLQSGWIYQDEIEQDYIACFIDNEKICDLYFLQSYGIIINERLLKRKLIQLVEFKKWKMLKKYIGLFSNPTVAEEYLISKYYECPSWVFSSRPSSNLLIQHYYNDEYHFQNILNDVDQCVSKEILLKMKTSHLAEVISRFPNALDDFTDKEKVDCLVSSLCNQNQNLSNHLVTRYANLFTHMNANQYERCNHLACGLGMYDIADKLQYIEEYEQRRDHRIRIENGELLL